MSGGNCAWLSPPTNKRRNQLYGGMKQSAIVAVIDTIYIDSYNDKYQIIKARNDLFGRLMRFLQVGNNLHAFQLDHQSVQKTPSL